jgi:hypothetical protein
MSDREKSKSVLLAGEKARELRVTRVRIMLESRLVNAAAAIDALIAEAADGDPQVELWERLHGASLRDGVDAQVADAYQRAVGSPRMKRLEPSAQADVLMHAADFFLGIRGDADAAEAMLERVLALVPDHPDAFPRLERRLEKVSADRRLVEMYARVASSPPRPVATLATQALHRLVRLAPSDPASDEACRQLVALVPTNEKVMSALDAHCRATKRFGLLCELLEAALELDTGAPKDVQRQRRHRLVELSIGEAATPTRAMDQIDILFEQDPGDAVAVKAAERLMSSREVSSRAAAALQKARRARGY